MEARDLTRGEGDVASDERQETANLCRNSTDGEEAVVRAQTRRVLTKKKWMSYRRVGRDMDG